MEHDYARQYADLYRRHWWWRSREAAIVQAIRRLTDLPDQAKILDVGCGDALSLPVLESLSAGSRAWGIEVDPNTILSGNPMRDRIYDKPLGDPLYRGKRFDLITALDVIEHIEGDRSAVENMMHMLKPGGWLLITVPALPMLWTRHDEINMHFRRYTRGSLTDLLQPFGELRDCRYLYTALALPKLLLAGVEWLKKNDPSPAQVPNRLVNLIAQVYFKAEWSVTSRYSMPFGSSLMAVVRKPAPTTITSLTHPPTAVNRVAAA